VAFWREFQPDLFAEFLEDPVQTYPKLARLTSLARSRAKIQNDYRLFQASRAIRQRRKQLSEEERTHHAEDVAPSPTITVYADESGKTGQHLLVGSVWFIDSADTWRLLHKVTEWRRASGFDGEFHFSELTEATLGAYNAFIDLVFAEIPLISFKSVRAPRAGIRSVESAFDWLFYELVRRGLEHEHSTGRAVMPRRLILYKDEDSEGRGRDVIALAKLKESLTTASATHFGGGLLVEVCEALNSKDQPLLQLADLYTGSLNRALVRQQSSARAKDVFADRLLDRIRQLGGPEFREAAAVDAVGDMEVHIAL
jgi:hypothetical protein